MVKETDVEGSGRSAAGSTVLLFWIPFKIGFRAVIVAMILF